MIEKIENEALIGPATLAIKINEVIDYLNAQEANHKDLSEKLDKELAEIIHIN